MVAACFCLANSMCSVIMFVLAAEALVQETRQLIAQQGYCGLRTIRLGVLNAHVFSGLDHTVMMITSGEYACSTQLTCSPRLGSMCT